MKRLLEHPPPVDGVVVWSLDRLGRDPANLKRDLKNIQAAGVRLVSVTEPGLAPSNYARHIRAIADQSRVVSRSVHRALKVQREHGGMAGQPAYGFRFRKVKVPL
jgi:DNA invertase Pin-like site-specific DNA recombinase